VPELDLVMGPSTQPPGILAGCRRWRAVKQVGGPPAKHHILERHHTARRDSAVCGWVNVIYGCNERCTYCVCGPAVRGQEQSATSRDDRQEESKALAASGLPRNHLLGQNIDATVVDFARHH